MAGITCRPVSSWLRLATSLAPRAVALEWADGHYSYAELLAATERLSDALRQQGFRPGDRLGIAAARSKETIIAILAAVDSRLAYVPLDLTYPAERLQAMLGDARPRAVLGEARALGDLQRMVGTVPTLERPAAAAPVFAAADDLAYVLFTSGSTGRPKGVAMGLGPLAHLIEFHAAHPRLGQPARTLQFAPLSFDVHFQEIFSTIAGGGCLVLIPENVRRDPVSLHAALCQQKITRLFLPYVALQMLAEASADTPPNHLREVVSAGEQLQITPAIRSMFERLPECELHNHYGPTESHVVTAHELTGSAAGWPAIAPIGRALPHVRLAVRAPATDETSSSETGELLIGGETLAHGYIGRPGITSERFRNDIPGLPGRWYVTGDLVRRDAEGVHTYLGRTDQQLKVDGFRVEPGEIEVALMAHQAIKEAVVTAPETPRAGQQLTAYLVLRDDEKAQSDLPGRLRAHLRESLPEHMIPVRYIVLDQLPVTPSGKIDRRALPLPDATRSLSLEVDDPRSLVRKLWQDLLSLADIDDNQNLFELGAKSLLVLRFISLAKKHAGAKITVADIYDRPTIAGISAVLGGKRPEQRHRTLIRDDSPQGGIAIVGMATRTAGASNVDDFWANLLAGREGIRHFRPEELDPAVPSYLIERPNFVAARGVLDQVDCFDAGFFALSAREATVLDPQQRLMLELSWTALEHAGIDTEREGLCVGVYAGTGNNAYVALLRQEQPELIAQFSEFATMLASEKDYVATRIAHRLDLHGPAISIHTACSTGLVAVAEAWHALRTGRCDLALAGGASVLVPQESGYLHVKGGMGSADGHCRPFDAEASGTVFSSGGAVVVLRRLEDALEAGDTIYAVIRGVGVNNDGGNKASFTAPSVAGQAAAIRMALDQAGCDARSIGYVEAHGTGTALGDPIEIAALTRAWREDTDDTGFCGVGSVKSNLGHTIAAAGVLGLVKAALALHGEIIPATLHYRRPNPQIDFGATPFYVVAQKTAWPRGTQPRRAAVSSFGVGGTNAHVVLEEGPVAPVPEPTDARLFVLPLSARTPDDAVRRAHDLADHLESHPELALEDVAATLMRGRRVMASRVAVVAEDRAEAVSALRAASSATTTAEKPRIVFLFPGQGSQFPGMARGLYDELPAFRHALDECMALVRLDIDLRALLLEGDPADTEAATLINETRYAQPGLFSVSYALASWLESLGIQPDAMIGHSIGEYVAACRAGVLSVEDAVAAVVARGAAMFAQPRGAMLAVRKDADDISAMLPPEIELAACNAPGLTVLAGPVEQIDQLAGALESQSIGTTRLRVSHAFHSASMEGALPAVEAALRRARLRPPRQLVYSCVSGAPLAADAEDPAYWAQQVRAPVQFSPAVQSELAQRTSLFVEVGPGQALSALVRQHRSRDGNVPRAIPLLGSTRGPGDPAAQVFQGLAALWCAGANVAWPVPATARRVALPTYPFQKNRHWFTRRPGGSAKPVESETREPPAFQGSGQVNPTPLPVGDIQVNRLPRIERELRRVLSDVSGISMEELQGHLSFLEQGLDSLSLTQASLELQRVFGVRLQFRRLMEDLDTIEKLAGFLDSDLPPESAHPPLSPTPDAAAAGTDSLLSRQLLLIEEQLRLVRAMLPGGDEAVHRSRQRSLPESSAPAGQAAQTAGAAPAVRPETSTRALVEKPFGASARITLDARQGFSPQQKRWLDEFVGRYNVRTANSKSFSQSHRQVMSDPRVVTGFNPLWKELVYPIVVERSKGARLWDIDGNEYIDLLSAFGANLLGYQPDYLVEAMADQLHKGLEVGPQHPLAAEVAQLIAEFTGMERVAFCNTGSEAVMGAMRIARTVTGRDTIAIFTDSYHGIFDEVIVRGTKQLRSLSAAPGILASAVENVLVLDYASDESLEVLRDRADSLAAIMIEPIQNKHPDLQPREFVAALREIADSAGCALIFDEVVTGFRVAPGGAQEFYGVLADIATYGKVIGGGLPFAAIAGRPRWLDALDGGYWAYGDDSYPEAGVTYFAGTFVRHPLALAAARAALLHLKKCGPEFQARLNSLTQELASRLNQGFQERGAPVEAVYCASLWRLSWDDDQKHMSLFYYLVRFHGLHLYEQFGHFVTDAFGQQEVDKVVEVFLSALDELMELGFITRREGAVTKPAAMQGKPLRPHVVAPPVAGARLGKDPDGRPAWFIEDPDRPGKYIEVRS